jgi:CheY-like chemotaxis protein
VLIVDDLPENCLLLGLYCDQFGVQHESAGNGYEALEAAQSGRFDLILMDILMPRMDGMAATRAIRALPSPTCEIPIIAVTTAAAPGEVLRYLGCGMNDVVAKPVLLPRLAEAISAALVKSRRDTPKRNGARKRSAA